MTRSQTPGDLSGFGSGRCFPASTNRRCDHSRSGDAYWVLSQLPLCSPLAYKITRICLVPWLRDPAPILVFAVLIPAWGNAGSILSR